MTGTPGSPAIVDAVVEWYARSARDLPWRRPGTPPWAVLVSEVMLQQTPVARVLPAYREWLDRWPTPATLAAAPAGEAVRQWGRLGYPGRALRLHATAAAIVADHDGRVPDEPDALRRLPGIGDYTAAAVAAFAFGRRTVVLDTNVRRVLARAIGGAAGVAASPTAAERARAAALLPADGARAAGWSVAVMELGALVCRARDPRCTGCPIARVCRWRAAGHPADPAPPRRRPGYAGTDRQARGALLAVVRDAHGTAAATATATATATVEALAAAWPEDAQRRRALHGLIADGLLSVVPGGYSLPS